MHQRHVKSPTSPKKKEGSNDNKAATQKRRRKRKQKREMQKIFLQRLLSCGMISMVLLLLLAVRFWASSSSTTTANGRLMQQQQEPGSIRNEDKFELYTPNAPSCIDADPADEIDYTLVTQLSDDRLWMMEYHCQRYPHKMSIAVYTNRSLDDVITDFQAMNCPVGDDSDPKNNVDVSILDSNVVGSSIDYPVNQLRNLAISKVQTSHIIYIDVDFWTSEKLYETMLESNIVNVLKTNPRQALVIPAFQLFRQCREWKDCRSKNIPQMPYNLQELSKMFNDKKGHIFDPTNKGGHGSTLYKEWMHQEPGTLLDIECLQSNRYEPFVVVRKCHELPPFQIQFSGYGKNKMTWMMQMIRSGYKLSQVGGVYLCHYPHLDSSSRQHWNEAPDKLKTGGDNKDGGFNVRKPKKSDGNLDFHNYKRGQVDKLYIEFRNWLRSDVPDHSVLGLCENAQDDDSKLWIDHTK